MKSKETYMQELKQWLKDTSDSPLEEMSDFFTKRLDGYEEHMSDLEKSYQMFADILPLKCRKVLDLGCGTGLELEAITPEEGLKLWNQMKAREKAEKSRPFLKEFPEYP